MKVVSEQSGAVIRTAPALALAILLVLAGCNTGRGAGGHLQVVAAFYPLQFVAEQVGGDRVRVTNLAPPGAEPHDLELSPRQVADIADASVVLYLHGFQPAVDEAVSQNAQDRSFNAGSAVPLISPPAGADDPDLTADPHVWLDPTRLATVADAVANHLSSLDPAGADGYHARARLLGTRLAELDAQFHARLAHCTRREIVVSHAAFGYLAQRYRLDQVSLSGLAPDAEPTPRHLAEAAEAARRHKATTIFFEELVSPAVAQVVAQEVGARTAVLDPIEGQPEDGDYLTAMQANLDTLVPALGCHS